MQRKNKIILYSFTTIVIMTVIFLFSAQNADDSSRFSEGFISTLLGRLFETMLPQFGLDYKFVIRKYAHVFEYFCLGVSMYMLLHEIQPKNYLFPAIGTETLCFLYACTDEWHQTFVPGRSGRFVDTFVDAIGISTAVILMSVALYVYNYRKR